MNDQVLNLVLNCRNNMGAGFSSATRMVTGLLDVVHRLTKGLLDLGRTVMGTVVGALQNLAGAALRVGGVLAGTLAAGLIAVGKAGVDTNITLATVDRAITKISGSATAAAGFIADLRKESLTSALTFKQMLPISQSLGAALTQVYGPAGLGKTIGVMRTFGDTAATLGVSIEDQQLALRGLRQLLAADVPTREDLKQIDEALPGAGVMDIVKRTFGTTEGKELKEANITGARVAEAIIAGMREKFGGAQAEMAGTLPVILSNFEDAFNNLAAAVTTKFTPVLTAAFGRLLDVVQGLAGNEKFIAALAVPFDLLGVAITKVADVLPGFVGWLSEVLTKDRIIDFIANVAGNVQALWQEVEKFLGIVTGGATFEQVFGKLKKAAGTAIDFAYKSWQTFTYSIEFFIDNAPTLWKALADSFGPVQDVIDTLIGAATMLLGLKNFGPMAAIPLLAPIFGGGSSHVTGGMGFGTGDNAATPVGGPQGEMDWGKALQGLPKSPQEFFQRLFGIKAITGQSPQEIAAKTAAEFKALGKGIREGATAGLQSAYNGLPQTFKDAKERYQAGVQAIWTGPGVSEFNQRAEQNAAAIKRGLNGATAGSPAVPATGNMPPAHQMFGGTEQAAQAGALSKQQRQTLLKNAQALREAQLAELQAYIDALPEQIRAGAAVERMVPLLQQQMQTLLENAQLTKEGTAERFGIMEKYWKTWSDISQIQDQADRQWQKQQDDQIKAQKDALEKSNKAAEGARSIAGLQLELAEATLKANPFLGSAQRQEGSVNLMAQRFGLLNRPVQGETQEDALRRMIEAQGVRGSIFDALGLGQRSVRSLGGGMMDVSNYGRMGAVDAELGRIAQQGQGMPFGGGGPLTFQVQAPTPDGNWMVQALSQALIQGQSDPVVQRAVADLMNLIMYRGSQAASPGPSY